MLPIDPRPSFGLVLLIFLIVGSRGAAPATSPLRTQTDAQHAGSAYLAVLVNLTGDGRPAIGVPGRIRLRYRSSRGRPA
jgi:hypothetical protein